MSDRFLLLLGASAHLRAAVTAKMARAGKLRLAIDRPPFLLLVDPAASVIDLGDSGAIMGSLFTPGHTGQLTTLSASTITTIRSSRGQHLIDRYWGGYVAILASPGQSDIDIVRAPFGWLPCLHCVKDESVIFASDLTMLVDAGLVVPRLDAAALARHLVAADIRRNDTCLTGLQEIRGGDRWSSDGTTSSLWSPWHFVATPRQYDDSAEAERQLRDVARSCIAALTPANGRSMLLLSGGLDSSIIAACLRHAHRDFAGLTYVTDNQSGDERRYARLVTDWMQARLLEGFCAVEGVDLMRSEAAHLHRPCARAFEQMTNALRRSFAAEIGADVIVGGGGGDNIFCSLQSPSPAADALLCGSGRGRFWQTSKSIAEMTRSSALTVARRAWLRARFPHPYRRTLETSFLDATASMLGAAALQHPWLDAPDDIPPGKAAHVALLIGAQGFVEDADPLLVHSVKPVLMAQPLVETCLRVPTWLWFERGVNRAAARRAFDGELPPEIAWRRTKGSPDSFLVAVYEANKPLIGSMLSEGVLAGAGLLDVDAIRAELDDPRPARGHTFARMLSLVDVEAWARGWPR